MGKGLLYQQQYYGNDGMWMGGEAQHQHQQSYAIHEDSSWGSENGAHHNQYSGSGMHMKPFAMEHGHGMFGGASRPGYYAPHGGVHNKTHGFGNPAHVFPNHGGGGFNHGGGHHNSQQGYYSEESAEYAAYSSEEHHGHGHGGHGHGHGYNYANPYDARTNMLNWNKPHGHGVSHKVEWTAKGV